MSPVTASAAWNPFEMPTLNVSPPTTAGPLSHALMVNVTAAGEAPGNANAPSAWNSSPLLAVAQKPEPKVNDVKELAVSVSPVKRATPVNDPCVPVASCLTSKSKKIRPPSGSGIVPVPFNSPVCGGGG